MIRLLAASCCACVAILAVGCKDAPKRDAASSSSVTPPTLRAVPKRKVPNPLVSVDAIPIEEDYEPRAQVLITEANLQAQLDELEKELSP